jgi:error-prone DNA polymerase
MHRLAQQSQKFSIPLVATNDVHYHSHERRQLQDVLTCIREGCTITTAGFRLLPNAERYLKPPEEMQRLFLHYPDALRRSVEIAEACQFSLDELRYEYPEEITTEGRTPQQELEYLAWKGATEFFGNPLPAKTVAAIKHELYFIEQMNYAAYFLTCMILCVLPAAGIYFARAVVRRLIPRFVFAWALHLSTPKSLSCFLNALSRRPATSHLILM